MNGKTVLLGVLICLLGNCRSKTEVLPSEVWSEGCAELAPYQGGYRLSGMCCEYVLLPGPLSRSFQVNGTYHGFTGAGFSNIPIAITGTALSDTTLVLSYSVNTKTSTFTLKPGRARMACNCACD
ncbi:hypothetical protein ACO2Q8_21790 [Larkinella sp. VNQ87]|uniref:hypothetical protein n=1 Tax=Larkinella sp. VNQ87 TaxID=3400921 RepID=UPI003C003094